MRKHNKRMAERSGLTVKDAKKLGCTRQQFAHQMVCDKGFQAAANTVLHRLKDRALSLFPVRVLYRMAGIDHA